MTHFALPLTEKRASISLVIKLIRQRTYCDMVKDR